MVAASAGTPTTRHPKFTPTILPSLIASARAGTPLLAAAKTAGVHRATIYDWFERGRKEPGGPFGSFARAYQRARIKGENVALAALIAATEDDETS